MNDPQGQPQYESILLRVLWMVIYLLVWQVAQSSSAPWCWCS